MVRKLFKCSRVQDLRFSSFVYGLYVRSVTRKYESEGSVLVPFRTINVLIERGDVTILPTLVSGEYEGDELDLFENVIGSYSALLDVGANVGIYSLLARKASESIEILAVEPNADVGEYLKRNMAENFGESVEVELVQAAVSNQAGEVAWTKTRYHATHHIDLLSQDGLGKKPFVAATTIDNLSERFVPGTRLFIKLDIEGYEPLAITGAHRTITRLRPHWLIEVCGRNSKIAGINWNDAIDVLSSEYCRITVFGPLSDSGRDSSNVGRVLSSVVADGRLHNVFLR